MSAVAVLPLLASLLIPGLSGGRVWFVDATGGNDSGSGRQEAPLKTLQEALKKVKPGDTIRLKGGVYTEQVATVRAGKPRARITIEAEKGAKPIIDGQDQKLNGPRIVHSYYTVRGLTVRNVKEGVRLEGVKGVLFEGNLIHRVKNECLRVRFGSTENTVRRNTIHTCGTEGNGEGIYIGTAPEQRSKYGGRADSSSGNILNENHIYNVEEGIDIKEDSERTTVARNVVYHATDTESGAINVRSDGNRLQENMLFDNQGTGIRIGGDITGHPKRGAHYHYGVNNVLAGNVALKNRHSDFKFMNGPQQADCTNLSSGLGKHGAFYFGDGVGTFVSCPVSLPRDLARYVAFHRPRS